MSIQARYDEKDAIVRYVPGKVTLDAILRRYDDTPFGVVQAGPVVTVRRTDHGTFRSWTRRLDISDAGSESNDESDAPKVVEVIVELAAHMGSDSTLSFADPPADRLAVLEPFAQADRPGDATANPETIRFDAKLFETVALPAGELIVPVHFAFAGASGGRDPDGEPTNTIDVVLRTTAQRVADSESAPTGVALIGGVLDLRLGHLCDQRGCVDHFHQSLGDIRGLGAVDPRPDLTEPSAAVYLRSGEPVDVWSFRETLRDRSIEIAGIVPRRLNNDLLRIELARWRIHHGHEDADHDLADDGQATDHHHNTGGVQRCVDCRDRVVNSLQALGWVTDVAVAGGGINFRPTEPDVDLVQLLDVVEATGVAPRSVWLLPAGVPMPKPSAPVETHHHPAPQTIASQAHPIVEFDLAHTGDNGLRIASLLHQQKWASASHVSADDTTRAWASIGDRKFAGLTPLLSGLRSAGHIPREIRLRNFGDIRIQLEFAHICGEIVYSKPPKPRKKKETDEKKKDEGKPGQSDKVPSEAKAEPKKPFVPQPVSIHADSNGRKAIRAAIESVSWVQDGLFYAYHTRFEFKGGPTKITFDFQAKDADVVRLDELIVALRRAGYPPKSVVVSRRFPGIPFGKPLPGDLQLTNRDGTKVTLASFRKPDRPLGVAFICLKTPVRKYGRYKPKPKLFERIGATIEAYKDRADFVAISANKHDQFPDVAEFWDETGLTVPLLHDADGAARGVFNAQVTPPPQIFVFDADGNLRYGGHPHDNWEKPDEEHDDYLAKAFDLVLARKYLDNGAVFYKTPLCNCSHPGCKCPKCGCGSSCLCGIGHCQVGF